MAVDVFRIALVGITGLLTLVIIFMMAVNLIGGHVKPLVEGMNPNVAEGEGMTTAQYDMMADHLWTGVKYMFYGIIGTAFFYIAMKYWYEKESTSVYAGGAD